MPNLLANIELTTGQSAPGAFADVLGMSAVVNVASVDSIILLIGSVPIAADIDTTNRAAIFRFAVGGVLEGPEVSAEVDNIDEGSGLAGFHYALTGLSGSQTFSLQWLNFGAGTATLDTGKVRNFQVIELLPGDTAAILANVQSTAAGIDSAAAFADVPAMTAGITVGGVERLILMSCTVPIDASDSADETAAFRFADGGVLEGAEILVFKDGVDQGNGLNSLLRAKIGISGAKTFSCQWATEGGAGALSLDTTRTRALQILEVTPVVPTAAVTGTATANIDEFDVLGGGKTIIITLTDDTWLAAGGAFDGIRQDIIDGLNSAQAEALGWNAQIRDLEVVGAVVRTSDTVVTITLTAPVSYDITAQEVITVTVPASALVTFGSPIVATPTFTVDFIAYTVGLAGDVNPGPLTEFEVRDGGQFMLINIVGTSFVSGAAFDAIRQDIIDGLDSAQSEATGWNAEVRDKIPVTDVVRSTATTVRIDFSAAPAYLITADETITYTNPGSSVLAGVPIVATPTFDVEFIPQGVVPSGDLVPTDFEQEIRNGGRTLLLTVNKDTWVAVGPTFDGIRQNIIDGLTSAQVEATGWNAEVRDKMPVTDVVRTSDTLVTITLSAQAAYNITADETITATIPASAVVTGGPYVGAPTFDIQVDPTATISGTVFPSGTLIETEVVAGGKTIIITLLGDTWVPNGMEFDGIRQDIIDEITSDITALQEPNGWNQDVRDNIPPGQCVRTSDTVVTITLVAVPTYETSVVETITVTVPPIALVLAESDVVGSPTFTVDPTSVGASGSTVPSSLELQIVNGGQELILTLSGDTWVAAGATFNAVRQAILDGLTSAQSEATGWNAEVRDKEVVTAVVRTSGTVVTITFSAAAAYNITTPETITATVPAAAILLSGSPVVATPTFNVNQVPTAIVGGTIAFSSTEGQIRAGGRTILLFLTDDTWVATGGAFEAQRQAIIDGLVSAQSEATGWNAEIVPNIPLGAVARTSDTLVTITLIPRNPYDITLLEEITVTIPGAALVTAVADLIALPDPGFQITPITTKGHARDRRGGAHAETGVDVNEPDANTYDVNTF